MAIKAYTHLHPAPTPQSPSAEAMRIWEHSNCLELWHWQFLLSLWKWQIEYEIELSPLGRPWALGKRGTVLEGEGRWDGKLAIIVRRKLLQPKAHPKLSRQLYPFNCYGIFVKTMKNTRVSLWFVTFVGNFSFKGQSPVKELCLSFRIRHQTQSINIAYTQRGGPHTFEIHKCHASLRPASPPGRVEHFLAFRFLNGSIFSSSRGGNSSSSALG